MPKLVPSQLVIFHLQYSRSKSRHGYRVCLKIKLEAYKKKYTFSVIFIFILCYNNIRDICMCVCERVSTICAQGETITFPVIHMYTVF